VLILLLILFGIAGFTNSMNAQTCTVPNPMTQADIDNFSTTNPGCTFIDGSMFLGPGVNDLSGLSNVTEVRDFFVIQDTDLTDLSGLNVEKVGITLALQGNSLLTSLNGAQSLDSINTLGIIGNPILTDISALENVVITKALPNSSAVFIENNAALSDCAINSICNAIIEFPNGADVTINNNLAGGECISKPVVDSVCMALTIEVCDGIDNDGDGEIDEGVLSTFYFDNDGDTFGDPANTIEACSAPAGYVSDNTDCDDDEVNSFPGNIEICDGLDNNCDGQIDEGFDSDNDGIADCFDVEECDGVDNDGDGDVDEGFALTTFYADTDNDTYGDPSNSIESCFAPTGYVSDNTDCDDGDSSINPGAPDPCSDFADTNCDGLNGVDNDGDGSADCFDCDDSDPSIAFEVLYFEDNDGDGFGSTEFVSLCSNIVPDGYVTNSDDCDDTTVLIQDDQITYYSDSDGDGFGNPSSFTIITCSTDPIPGFADNNFDCDDSDPSILSGDLYYLDNDGDTFGNPNIVIAVCDGNPPAGYVDNNGDCDDLDSSLTTLQTYFLDSDGDGFGSTTTGQFCSNTPPIGYTDNDLDCDDSNDFVHPNAAEVTYDGIDNDCNAATLDDDLDEDGFDLANDCDDEDDAIHPNATEVCDGVDNNCDGQTDEGFDSDGDGIADCNDTEVCDGVDNDGDGLIDEGVLITFYADADGDTFGDPAITTEACTAPTGYVDNDLDCDDARASVFPGAPELCDGLDNDCDGITPPEEIDADNDGISICEGDCEDDNPAVNPGIQEIPNNGVDDDCDPSTPDVIGGPSYCTASGSSTQYEWIESIDLNGSGNTSGNDNGYGDYTNIVFDAASGYNTIDLTPGFSGSAYNEYWSVFIDYNQDGDFEDSGELVYYQSSFHPVYGSFHIPTSALTGTTRMRILMSYNGWAYSCDHFGDGEVEDYTINISVCDNITHGGEIAANEALCGTTDDPAEITNVTGASGGSGDLQYIWLKNTQHSSPPNVNMTGWEEISNSDAASYDPGPISETTWYIRCARRAGCSQYTGESNVIEKSYQGVCGGSYCTSEGESTQYERILKVKLGSINNLSGDNGGYADFTNLSTSVYPGTYKSIVLKPGFAGSSYLQGWRVWIDWNQDGDFDDAGELEVQSASYGNLYKTISVPYNAPAGSTVMRVSMKYNGYADPCETFPNGEVEDYTINVLSYGNLSVLETEVDLANPTRERDEVEEGEEELEEAVFIIDDNRDAHRNPNKVTLYPNPTVEDIFLNLEEYNGMDAEILIVNKLGQMMYQTTIDNITNEAIRIPVNEYHAGHYILTIKVDEYNPISKSFIVIK